MTENIQQYINQITLARTEIKNLRQQLASLKYEHLKEIKCIKNVLEGLRCTSCGDKAATIVTNAEPVVNNMVGCIPFRPVGVIRTTFQNKRGVPRQTSIMSSAQGTVEIDTTVFTNPEHALCGLEEFSHMWIMFHFHMTESTSVPAMVSPPRLGGKRMGVFATRSPHRPCPIGLSLVKITKIEGNKIHFVGVDMVNGTPVLDVKPYIPQYDLPSSIGELSDRPPTEGVSDVAQTVASLSIDNGSSASLSQPTGVDTNPASPFEEVSPNTSPASKLRRSENERGAPDGQEHFTPQSGPIDNFTPVGDVFTPDSVRIASWISNPPAQVFEVTFTSEAYDRLIELIGERAPSFKSNIQSLLSEDPRSHYVRTRYPDHEFSCVLEDLSISCVFDAGSSICTIIAVRNAEEMQQT